MGDMTGQLTTDKGRPRLRFGDKDAPPGPWWGEPDRVEWPHDSGLRCLALRGPAGAWCGYVGVPKGHPLHGADYSGLPVEVHGGLTFAGQLLDVDGGWWLGFDCAHAGDVSPSSLAHGFPGYPGEVYRALPYVLEQVEQLARWVADRGWPATEDPNAPCMCGHVLISHRPPLFECLAYNRAADEWHGCHCERFIEELSVAGAEDAGHGDSDGGREGQPIDPPDHP